MTAPAAIPVEQLHDSIDRIARTAEGRDLYLFLQRRLMAISNVDSDGALRIDQGERTFAAKLIGLMAKGISESGGRTSSSGDTSGTGSGEQPIVFAAREPVRVSGGPGSSRRRVTADTRVAGWSDPESE